MLKNWRFSFPHWPPSVPYPPYSLSLQMVELSIYPTEHCRAAHPSTGYLVKQLQPHLGNRIIMDPSCASACMSIMGVLSEVPHINPLFGPKWYSWKDKVVLSFSRAPRKRRERQIISFFPSVSLFISCWQIWGIPGLHTLVPRVEPVPVICLICSVASNNPNMWSNIFLLEVFCPEAFPVLVKPCNGV